MHLLQRKSVRLRLLFPSLLFSFAISNAEMAFAASATSETPPQPSKFSSIGPWTLSAGFPQGGSSLGAPALSIRNEVLNGEFVTIGVNLSSDRQSKSESTGVFLKWNHMLSAGWGKSFPYAFIQTGYLTQKASESAKKESSAVAACGLGVEVSLLREISTSVETGLGGVLWPSERTSYTAATTQLSIHYHFDFQ